jgi:pimeloyl-ACP methyl ester carboxylesterase
MQPQRPLPRVRAADGVDVAVRDLGGSGPPVVLAHATGLHGQVWAPMAAHLADAFSCVAFDSRGHGDSGLPPDDDFDWRGLALDALAVVEAIGTPGVTPAGAGGLDGRPFGVGHSSGGAALLLAEEARPGTFAALYCFEPILVAADPPLGRDRGNWLAAGARRRRETFASTDEAMAHYATKAPFDRWAPEALAAYVDDGFADLPDGTVRLKCRGEHEALVYEMATAHDGFSRLGEVGCPVLLAWGADSDAVGPEAIAALAGPLPRARTQMVPGVGHFGPLEDPGAVAASVRAFLLSSEPGQGR